MRAIVLLCLLHTAYATDYPWDGHSDSETQDVCLLHQAACGCCLMQRQMHRMETFFNTSYVALKEMTRTKLMVNGLREFPARRSAFSVALNNANTEVCFGPFNQNMFVVYKHIFINLGNNYNMLTGIFTVPRSGVYSLSVTVYSTGSSGNKMIPCISLQVNKQVVSALSDQSEQDPEDSGTIYLAMKLKVGDQVAVNLFQGCVICDFNRHYSTFTGFLLYTTE